jgi:teichoic acid transport system ATP-binding protein
MCSDVVIRAEGLTKSYRVFAQSADRLRQAVTFGRRQYYKRFTALDNVSFEIRKGETVGIIGRNGSGKSTLLQLVCGILKPSSGRVEVNGRISALLELGAGFHPDFTGRENVLFYATVLGMPREQIERRLPDIENFADIGEFMDQPVRTYSSGMYVRLAFATAIHTDPDILVVDEALAVGDAAFQAKCFERVSALGAAGCTILVVSHDFATLSQLCSRLLLLDRGGLLLEGEPRDVVGAYRDAVRNQAVDAQRRASLLRGERGDRPEESAFPAMWTAQFRRNDGEHRYGSRQAELIEAGLFDQHGLASQVLVRGEPFQIRIRVGHHEAVPAPVVSFSLSDSRGNVLSGTTSLMENAILKPMERDSIAVFTFRQVMRLNPGAYFLDVAYQHFVAGSYLPFDVRLRCLGFEVVSSGPGIGAFDPGSDLEWAIESSGAIQATSSA